MTIQTRHILRRAVSNPRAAAGWLRTGRWRLLWDHLRGVPYAEAYQRHQNRRIKRGTDHMLGADDDGVGALQLDFLTAHGLARDDRLLDVGCGPLRAGAQFVDYLDAGEYIGLDISDAALAAGRERLPDDVPADRYTLFQNDDLRFAEVAGTVDVILAHSLWTHLPPALVVEMLAHAPDVLAPDGVLFATIHECDDDWGYATPYPGGFAYGIEFIRHLARAYGWRLEAFPESAYPHPHGQRMLTLEHTVSRDEQDGANERGVLRD